MAIITLKVKGATEDLDTLNFDTSGSAVQIKASKDVNYLLIDNATGFAPENIAVKRSGQDLMVAFEGSDISDPDLVIEGYYDYEGTNLLVGQHENGLFYAYVPESGQVEHAVSQLAEEVAAGQALGGNTLANPAWMLAPAWLLAALLPVGAIAAAGGGGGGGGSGSAPVKDTTAPSKPTLVANNDGSVTVTPATDPDVKKTTITYTDEDGKEQTVEFTKGADGKWNDNNPDDDITVDPTTGVVTIPEATVKDGSEVEATNTDDSGNTGEIGSVEAKDVTAPSKPGLTANDDGSVTITVPDDAEVGDTVVVEVVPEGATEPVIVELEKQDDGSWTSSNPTIVPDVPAGEDTTTIPGNQVEDGSTVTATSEDPAGNKSEPATVVAGDSTAPSAPVLDNGEQGDVTLTVPADAEPGDKVVVEVVPEGATEPVIVEL
ncbi:MAG: hypothetical protein Q4G44_00210, partial [Alcaligenaceae bacterium]|nr:hypothetical protein [Alcaligenaceae bacterium]